MFQIEHHPCPSKLEGKWISRKNSKTSSIEEDRERNNNTFVVYFKLANFRTYLESDQSSIRKQNIIWRRKGRNKFEYPFTLWINKANCCICALKRTLEKRELETFEH